MNTTPPTAVDHTTLAQPSAHASAPTVTLVASLDQPGTVDCTIVWADDAPLVVDAVQMFQSLGVRVARHTTNGGAEHYVLLDWPGDVANNGDLFREALGAIHSGAAERDGLNRLVLQEQLTWRQVMLLRALCRYLRQTGLGLGLEYIQDTLVRNGSLARAIVARFEARFDPDRATQDGEQQAVAHLEALLDEVTMLDEDRVLRSLSEVVRATVRTSFFQVDRAQAPLPRLTLKIEPRALAFVPEPRPLVETFVYSPLVEGLHLRTARVARGGLRWSERPEDFRAEVLGLVKAQQVKNSVIVPAGAKGAFVLRTPLTGFNRDAAGALVRAAYATFIRGLLDVTDNLVDGIEQRPSRVRCHDVSDPYLVVAADKGTATFSDLANAVAAEYGFWLGDAFASGGSSGYDHKGMGITARGAWVSVEAHLEEMGFDAAREPFTVVGIGDMSGDVFGNGMLLSEKIRLVAAFDHRHIFIDPDPDPDSSYAERQRLFALPASDWTSYDPTLISPGGGVYSRSSRRIPLSAQTRERLGITAEGDWASPNEVVRAILTAPVTLLWNGGIGTYVKSSAEGHTDARDKANDPVRVDATELRCRVVGEGGNLGFTQPARIEYARRGGRINADFVDNSAGVDTSDHEVNLKILLNHRYPSGERRGERDRLLASMQDEVAHAVLEDNRRQARAISLALHQGPLVLDRHARLIALLEKDAGLDRRLEHLPDDEDIARRRAAGEGLSRPELATLLAWSKISVREALLDSELPSDPAVQAMLGDYFPAQARTAGLIEQHPLARQIAGTVLANDIVNQAGPGFFVRLEERTGALLPDAAAAFAVARDVLRLGRLWAEVDEQASAIPVAGRLAALTLIQQSLEEGACWLLRNRPSPLAISDEIDRSAHRLADAQESLLNGLDEGTESAVTTDARMLTDLGVPEALARRIAESRLAGTALDIAEAAATTASPLQDVVAVSQAISDALGARWLQAGMTVTAGDPHWLQLAKTSSADELMTQIRTITVDVLDSTPASTGPAQRVAAWLEARPEPVRRYHATLAEVRAVPEVNLAMLSVLAQHRRELARSGRA